MIDYNLVEDYLKEAKQLLNNATKNLDVVDKDSIHRVMWLFENIMWANLEDANNQLKELHTSRESLLGYKAKLENPDYVLVPKEPTQVMIDTFPEVEIDAIYTGDFMHHITDEEVTNGYKAMIKASQEQLE